MTQQTQEPRMGETKYPDPEVRTDAATGRTFTGEMATMDDTGDTKTMWSKDNADEVAIAKETFKKYIDKGFTAFRAEGKDGTKGEQMREFDPNAERVIFVPKMAVGGYR